MTTLDAIALKVTKQWWPLGIPAGTLDTLVPVIASPLYQDVMDAMDEAITADRLRRRRQADTGPCCDLCDERTDDWVWVDEGWSLVCRACAGKVVRAVSSGAPVTA